MEVAAQTKNISIGNMLLSSSILHSGNTFDQISEIFKMINIACFSKARFFEIQKTLLFPVVNQFYKMLRDEYMKDARMLLQITSPEMEGGIHVAIQPSMVHIH